MSDEWTKPEHALAYLNRSAEIPHRLEGESTLISEVPPTSKRILDLGCGDGRLLSLVLQRCENATGTGLDVSPTMLDKARERFADDERASFVQWNMDESLPELGCFDCIVSSFAIHHCSDDRKRELYAEAYALLNPGGVFCNLEHVSSPNEHVHSRFLRAMKMTPADEDSSNKLLDVETQLDWLRDIGFENVDCYWKWRELALLIGCKPVEQPSDDSMKIDNAPLHAEMKFLEKRLSQFNERQVGRDDFKPLTLVIRRRDSVIAGLKAVTGWNWLYVQILWVRESDRDQGLGSRLIVRAEQLAKQRGCIGSCLSTFSFQAPAFYKRHGYSTLGRIDDYPDGESIFLMGKRFAKSNAHSGPVAGID